ncbi:MAG: hypothetical protein EPO07_15770 [Verrucomicrobia bacterium]|nr:MAG: hypothetical protein EPO07_15770 [Verrucomicrobiota bacterium]
MTMVGGLLFPALSSHAAVGVTISPAIITNDFVGKISITVTGLTSGKTIRIEKFPDFNTNGAVNAPENKFLWRSFLVTDGQMPLLGSCTNLNVVGDMDGATNSQLRADLFFPGVDSTLDHFALKYLIRVSDPANTFTAITNSFEVRQKIYPQGVTGKVVASGTGFPLTNALVVVAHLHSSGGYGAVADSGGNFTIYSPAGTYQVIGVYTNTFVSGTVTVSSNVVTSQNFTSTPAPFTISGKVSDISGGAGLPGVVVTSEATNGFSVGFTDTNGNYSLPVNAGVWRLQASQNGAAALGYVGLGDRVSTNVTGNITNLNFQLPKATALVYGQIKDELGNPLLAFDCYAEDAINFLYETAGNSYATNGAYSLGVLAGDWYLQPESDTLAQAGYDAPQGVSVTVSNGQCLRVNFTALRATNHITGFVKDTGNLPIADMKVDAYVTFNGSNYQTGATTDGTGFYSLPVANGNWNVSVDCDNDQGLPSRGYCCVNSQNVNITNGNGVANFTATVSGQLVINTTSPLPTGEVGTFYSIHLDASSCQSLTWSATNPPPGLSLSSSGDLSGFPTTAGSNYFFAQVTDGSQTTNRAFSLIISNAPAAVPDVSLYYVTKLKAFRQTSAASPALDTNNGPYHAFLAIVQSDFDTVPIANVELPGGANKGFPFGNSALALQIHETFSSQASFDSTYTNGDYTFGMACANDGFQFPVLTMPPPTYPNAPRVTNYAAAQSLNPASAFPIYWDAFSGGTTNDSIWLYLLDGNGLQVFSTPYPSTDFAGALKGNATTTTIPGGVLQVGRTYTGILTFFKLTSSDTSSYPGAFGGTFAGAQTSFALTTPSTAPTLGQPVKLSSTQFRFTLSGLVGSNYVIQFSTNLSQTNWATLFTTNAPVSLITILDPAASNNARFYRARLGP